MRSIDSPWVPHNGPGGTFQGQLTAEMHVQSGNCTWKQNLCALQARDTAIPILEWFTLHPFNTDTTAPVPTFPFQLLDQFRNALIGLRDEHDLASRQQTTSDGKPAKNGHARCAPLGGQRGHGSGRATAEVTGMVSHHPAQRPRPRRFQLRPWPHYRESKRSRGGTRNAVAYR